MPRHNSVTPAERNERDGLACTLDHPFFCFLNVPAVGTSSLPSQQAFVD